MTSLYGITTDILELERMLERLEEEGEVYEGASDDMAQFLVAPKEEELASKIDAYVQVVRGREASIKARKAEIQHLQKMNGAEANAVDRLKEAVKDASQQLGRPKLKGHTHSITVSTSKRPAIEIVDDRDVPAQFKEQVLTWKVDKKAIVDHLMETGEIVDGIEARPVTTVRLR
uniref:Host-nuclease inhibitor protein n=1 Tax=viral metagenome TaxID=1070528 RepID=A0A6M3X8K1_9ZZZZ